MDQVKPSFEEQDKGQPTSTIQVTSTNVGNTNNARGDINQTTIGQYRVYNTQNSLSLLEEIEQRLNPVAAAAYDSYVSKAEKCFQGTRVKLLEEIWDWVSGKGSEASIYVLDGVAGIGKSTVAQTIAYRAAKEGMLGASYFFTRDELERQTTQRFAPTIAYQLAKHNKTYAHQLIAALKQHPDVTQKQLRQQLATLILEPLQKSRSPLEKLLALGERPILIVIDALDECNAKEAKSLLSLLADDFQAVPKLRIFITSRPEFHVRQVLDHHHNHERFHLHEIEDSIVHADIRLYLEFHLSSQEIPRQLPGVDRSWQPNPQEMTTLCRICGTLFVIASTALKFILDEHIFNPRRQLAQLLDGVSSDDRSSSARMDTMDRMYMHVLLSALPDNSHPDSDLAGWVSDYQIVFGAVLALQDPLSRRSLAGLLEVDSDYIERTLARLHSLVAPRGQSRIYRVHHKTFPDFITDEGRISKALRGLPQHGRTDDSLFLIDMRKHHSRLAKQCFRIMQTRLKKNICGLTPPDQYKDSVEVQHLTQGIVSPDSELAYACTQWAFHLEMGEPNDELGRCLEEWAFTQLLPWLEVLGLIKRIDSADGILERAERFIVHVKYRRNTQKTTQLLSDARRLVYRNWDLFERAFMHVYWSMLPFAPTDTRLYETYGQSECGLGVVSRMEGNRSDLIAILEGHSYGVASVAFSSDGSRLASGSDDKTVRLWDGTTGAHIATLRGHSSPVTSVAFSSNGSRLASGSDDKTVRLWDGTTGAHIATLKGHSSLVTSVAFSSDGSRLASGSWDKTARLWDGNMGAHIATLKGHSSLVTSVAFSSDGSRLASGSWDKTVWLWDGNMGAHIATLEGHSFWVTSVAFSSDGLGLASGSSDDTVRLWDGNTGARIYTFAHDSIIKINDVSFPPPHSPSTSTSTKHLFILVQRQKPLLSGLIALIERPDGQWDSVPFLWFPPHLEAVSFAVNSACTSIAVGCGNGRVLLLDISKVAFS